MQTGRRAQLSVLVCSVLITVADQYVRSLKKVLRASGFRVSFVDLPGPGPSDIHVTRVEGKSTVASGFPPPEEERRPTRDSVPGKMKRERAGLSETGGERTKRVGPHEIFGFGYGAEPSDMSTHHGRIL